MSRRAAYCALLGSLAITSLVACVGDSVGYVTLYATGLPPPGTQAVVLSVRSFELGGDPGQIDIDPHSPGNLQAVFDGNRNTIMRRVTVHTGLYRWVRLDIDRADSYVLGDNGARYTLEVPGVFESAGEFQVGETQTASVVVYVDLRRALSSTLQGGVPVYTLRQESRLADLQTVGRVTGEIAATTTIGSLSLSDPSCDPQAYAYEGSGAVPAGYAVPVAGGVAPFAAAPLTLNATLDEYFFQVTLLPPGTYTVALTCAATDTAGASSLAFSPTVTATVKAGTNSIVTIP